jgi:hypothetical protein
MHTISVVLLDHILQLRLIWIDAQTPHDDAKLLARNCSVSIFVEHVEGLAELCKRESMGHVCIQEWPNLLSDLL